ncbi:MAG: hypothetical protein IPO00_14780 [Betaproteobacteria bacterium]|nr:hypothetical protein [Betaproteobacteria bacterium]
MKIESSQVGLEASHSYDYQYSSEASGTFSFRGALQDAAAALPAEAVSETAASEDAIPRVQLMLQQLVATILEMLSGQKCRCGVDDIAELKKGLPPLAAEARSEGTPGKVAANGPRLREFEWRTTTTEHIEEHERTAVSATGQVKTADGREISFELDLSMCRDYSCTRESTETGKIVFRDPLVINFNGTAAELTDTRFSFDLDADGSSESVPMLARGSGYLVLDGNGDGRINDGRELFGATGTHAGDGFADLTRFDADKNGWIDEADPAYAALGVWFPDGKIAPLKEAGVGALNLASAWSPFALKDENNVSRGQIWRTGVYLAEDGRAGTLQQIDLGVTQGDALPPTTATTTGGTSLLA